MSEQNNTPADETSKTKTEHGKARPGAAELTAELEQRLKATAESVVPWFIEQMPVAYFQDTDRATQAAHLSALIGVRAAGIAPRLTLKSDDGEVWTFIHEGSYPGVLARLLRQLPRRKQLGSAKVHTTNDNGLSLDVFRLGETLEAFDEGDPRQSTKRAELLALARQSGHTAAIERIEQHLSGCAASYVCEVPADRLLENWRIYERALASVDDTIVVLDPDDQPGRKRFGLATTHVEARSLFERIVTHLGRYQIDIHRAYLDLFATPDGGRVALFGFVVLEQPFLAQAPDHPRWKELHRDLHHLKWIDSRALALLDTHPDLGLLRAEVIIALCHLAHAVLGREDGHAFSLAGLGLLAERYIGVTREIADFFLARFDPQDPLDEATCSARASTLRDKIGPLAQGEPPIASLPRAAGRHVEAALRTNVFVEGRYALAIRIDPTLMSSINESGDPYGVFFIHGRGFNGFHTRFRDVARGGLRVVLTLGPGEHGRESVRLYDETYGLAFAQQLKNKDIPEGGSKAVMLVEPGTPIEPSVKAFADSLLDLMSPDPALRANVVDLWGKEELLYLGPDENISAELIDWIVERARRRGHAMPGAFMSSKPNAGINHKEYGVTSEGVTVFLEEALRATGIDPRREPFTVKLTGGPDGDVAGNEIRILRREFADNARIVGIADGSGSAEDPDGLDHDELLRLFAAAAPIAAFDREKLGIRGRVTPIDAADGRRLRNTLHNRLRTDAFVPAGGRPATINDGNWRDHIDDEGPKSRVIVEGANLFITPHARRGLSEAGVLIVKDSSANKCGVICSSHEIVASMLLNPDEFLAIKDEFVEQVLQKLRHLARREARLLFREQRQRPGIPLPDISVELSRAILQATDAIEQSLPLVEQDEAALLQSLIHEHIPTAVLRAAGTSAIERIPASYRNGIIASSLAARIVYREGIDYLNSVPTNELTKVALHYIRTERETTELVAEVESSGLEHRDRIVALLQQGGARAGVTIAHERGDDGQR
jgi:glutamate dehydrogenase